MDKKFGRKDCNQEEPGVEMLLKEGGKDAWADTF